MNNTIRICSKIDLVKHILYLVTGLALLSVGIITLSNEGEQAKRLGEFGLALLGAIFAVIALFGFYWLSYLKREFSRKDGFDATTAKKYSIFATIFAQMPTGVACLIELHRRKKEQKSRGMGVNELFAETRPEYDEGYDSKNNTIVRLVANGGSKKAYQTRGIEDIGSKNNWKGWLYLAPVIILVAVFLIYPLVNTIFISFTEDYNYATGTFSGITPFNFTYILGLTDRANGAHESYFVNYAIPNTIICVIVTVPVSTLLALLISLAATLNRLHVRKGNAIKFSIISS